MVSGRLFGRSSCAGILSKRLNRSRWFSVQWLPLDYPTLCYKRIRVSPRITLCQTLKSANFSAFSPRYVDCHKRFQLVRPSQVYLTAFTFVYSTFAVTQRVARFVCERSAFCSVLLYSDHDVRQQKNSNTIKYSTKFTTLGVISDI